MCDTCVARSIRPRVCILFGVRVDLSDGSGDTRWPSRRRCALCRAAASRQHPAAAPIGPTGGPSGRGATDPEAPSPGHRRRARRPSSGRSPTLLPADRRAFAATARDRPCAEAFEWVGMRIENEWIINDVRENHAGSWRRDGDGETGNAYKEQDRGWCERHSGRAGAPRAQGWACSLFFVLF